MRGKGIKLTNDELCHVYPLLLSIRAGFALDSDDRWYVLEFERADDGEIESIAMNTNELAELDALIEKLGA